MFFCKRLKDVLYTKNRVVVMPFRRAFNYELERKESEIDRDVCVCNKYINCSTENSFLFNFSIFLKSWAKFS